MKRISKKQTEKRIERLYYANCRGVQINILDIPKVFSFAEREIARYPDIDDAALGANIKAYVSSITVAA